MLVVTRLVGQEIDILTDPPVKIKFLRSSGLGKISLGIDVDSSIQVFRHEINPFVAGKETKEHGE